MDKQQEEVTLWIQTVLGEKFEAGTFHDLFKDGVRLCRFLNKVSKLDVKYKESKQIFVQRENICSFINGLKKLKMNEYELFQTNDLFEAKDLKQVVICLYALSRQLQKEKIFKGPFIGPALATKSKIEFSKEVLDRSKYAVHLQMGYSDPELLEKPENKIVSNVSKDLKTSNL
ncbi:calponin H2-like calcium-binding protein [Encephalitozoon intestinalis ATCC 50506]|uniref:Calponin H2-like calcium-binding protein n=1 Tax=Encephalitozoon intestinalis (strain ATCC 50506) TaxID=876142 RepID=E0S6B3_ENCIT|nr:calponin H2-like calcium-binding protein [Encephalitozoon intestinalis ATCC 50506]ADM11248.1 calponin H2-like calcium-binding protein [Encephalitozoon intestinalis ATCC 50506]UTX44917.1 calponin domain-containing protein [Encephalitozoon intestinalis]